MILSDILIIFIIILIVIFFVSIIKFLFPKKMAMFDFESDVEKATPISRKQEKIITDKTLIGANGHKQIFVDNNAKHIFICGTTGSGKTVALANFIKSGIDYDYPMLIVDGKGDTDENSIIDIVNKLSGNKKVYILNLNNPQNSGIYHLFIKKRRFINQVFNFF